MTNQKISQYTMLAEVSYADFVDITDSKQIKDSLLDLEFAKNENDAQLDAFIDNWDVKVHWKDRGSIFNFNSGFSGTLFQNKKSGEYILGLKGTDGGKDLFVADGGDIVHDGLAHHQIVDMYNFWKQITTKGTYQAAKIITDIAMTSLYKAAITDSAKLLFVEKTLKDQGYFVDSGIVKKIVFENSDAVYQDERANGLGIEAGKVSVIGHSLGGHLAAAFSRLFPDETEHAYMVNGAGFGAKFNLLANILTISEFNIREVFKALDGKDAFEVSKITNITGDKNFDLVAQDWLVGLEQHGKQPEIFIENVLKNTFGHGSSQMTDTMMVSSLFFKLDKSLDEGSINNAFKILTPVFNASANQEDQSLESALYALDKMLSDDKSIVTKIETDNRDQLYEKIKELSNKIDAAKASGKIISLADTDFDWQKEAGKDTAEGIAIRYALKEFNPFAVVGFDYSKINQDKTLDLSSKDNPKGMSKSYIDDRAAMLALKLDYDVANKDYDEQMGSFGIISQFKSGDWQYKDIGKNLNLEIDGVNLVNEHQIIFGSEKNDHLAGGKLNDRLYGGAGDDTLYGGAGDDRMEGGAGFDRYFIEGFDTVFDSDGKGALYFGDLQLTPGTLKAKDTEDNVWQSMDEKGNATTEFVATRERGKDDLKVVFQSKHSVIIEDFFSLAERGERDAYKMLGLTLETLTEEEKMPKLPSAGEFSPASMAAPFDKYNIFYLNETAPLSVTGGQKDDIVFGLSANKLLLRMGGGNDKVWGSFGTDAIYGEDGNDILWGSANNTNRPQEELDKDRDFIVGGDGRDMIYGVAGDDIIHTGNEGDHLKTEGNNAQGDWALGGLGNDAIFGSSGRDFLMGGAGRDTIHGGASDDVILGDGQILFHYKNQFIYIESDIPTPGYGTPSVPIHPLIPVITPPGYSGPPIHTIGAEHTLRADGNWDHKNINSATKVHPDTDKWDVTIDAAKGDYTLESVVTPTETQHLTEGGDTDFLYGGAGNDLIIGQTGDDFLFGEDGDDILWGDDNRDLSISGNDYLDGGQGDDTLYGGLGDDILIAGSGSDKLFGGEGFDGYWFSKADLQNGEDINTIEDADGKGYIAIDHVRIDDANWVIDDNNPQRWSSNKGWVLTQNGNDLTLSGKDFQASIVIKNFQDGVLGISLPKPNVAPQVHQAAETFSVNEKTYFTHTLPENLFKDEGDWLRYSITQKDGSPIPSWLHYDAATRTVSGYATPQAIGETVLNITATDSKGLSASQPWTLKVLNVNDAPQAHGALDAQELRAGQAWSYTLPTGLFSDEDGDVLSHSITLADGSALPLWLQFDAAGMTLRGTAEQAEVLHLRVVASDPSGASASVPLTLNIAAKSINHAPEIAEQQGDLATTANQIFTYTLPENLFSDADNDPLAYIITQSNGQPLPAWINYDAASKTLSGTAQNNDAGSLQLNITATDPAGASVTQSFTLSIAQDNTVSIQGLGFAGMGDDVIAGSAGNDTIHANAGHDTVYAGKGDDTVYGGIGNDRLFGEEGADKLYGGIGNDTLSGGRGNDRLEGGIGDDTYLFAKGDGKDTIYDLGGSNDTLLLSELTVNDLWFGKKDNHLEISIIGSEDKITIENQFLWFFGHPNQVENIRLENGKEIKTDDLDKLIKTLSGFSPQTTDTASLDTQMQHYLQKIDVNQYWSSSEGII
ncbi:MAG: putative Ig domain-containing protein [Neisseria sp.]|nr:putative Ig domain-containing protein [Neisseria sp.]